jgi:dCTP deaminase
VRSYPLAPAEITLENGFSIGRIGTAVGKMDESRGTLELFSMAEDGPPTNVVDHPANIGVLPYQSLRNMEREGELRGIDISPDQFQPASVDLRLGRRAWRVRASFLPGPKKTVLSRLKELGGDHEMDLTNGAILEKGIVYVVELLEHVRLKNGLIGASNPKSSTGRLDVLVRLITDEGTAFDRIERGYKGPLYLEVAPQHFSIRVHHGSRLNQVRFHRGTAVGAPATPAGGIQDLYERGQLIKVAPPRAALRGSLVPVTVDLRGENTGGLVGYRAKKTTNVIDINETHKYDPREFWERLEDVGGRLYLDKGEFYILATREEVGVPPHLAAEMVAYDTASGEFRAHYAGFFDPGFGYVNGKAGGSRAVLEVRSHGVSFMLEHGQIVGWLYYSRLAGGQPDKTYGAGIGSNYEGQDIALSKHFKPWPA